MLGGGSEAEALQTKRRERGWREARSLPGAELACRWAAGTTVLWLGGLALLCLLLGRSRAEGLHPFLKEKGAGSRALSPWGCAGGRRHLLPVLQWRGTRAPRRHQILLFLFQLPFVSTIVVVCFAGAFPGTDTIFKVLQRWREVLSVKA